jgi:hypothetical protein
MNRPWLVIGITVCIAFGLHSANGEDPKPQKDAKPVELGELTKPFKISMELKTAEKSAEVEVFFVGDSAVEMDPEAMDSAAAIYDLKNLSWYDVEKKKTTTIADCEKWAESSLKRSQLSLRKLEDAQERAFLSALYVPRFTPEMEKDELVLKNDAVEYRIVSTDKHPANQRNRYFAYDRLNAYRKALVNKAPPFAQLEVDKVLQAREVFPTVMSATIKAPYSEIRLDCKMKVVDLTAEEERKITYAIKSGTAKP